MKRCPTCNRTFTDTNLSFCIEDGTPLLPVAAAEDETTIVSPPSSDPSGSSPAPIYEPRDWRSPAYQPPGSQTYGARQGRTWPWVVGIVAVVLIAFVGLGIAAALLIPQVMRRAANTDNSNSNVQRNSENNSNLNSNASDSVAEPDNTNENANPGSDSDLTGSVPTDKNKVLADLTELEHEWTVANINADKKRLDRILADDYVGTQGDGSNQTKAEYLANVERDTSIESWDFEDLKVTLTGDRASLTGVLRFHYRDGAATYRFTDKFVWRDERWQAVSSEVKRVE